MDMQTFASFISVGNYSDTSVAGVIVKVSRKAYMLVSALSGVCNGTKKYFLDQES